MSAKPIVYSTNLTGRRAMINHTNAILTAYEPSLDKKDLVKVVCEGGYLSDMSWSTASEIVTRYFAKRYMSDDFSYSPAQFMSPLEQEVTGYKVADRDIMFFIFTALIEMPLFDFVSKYFYTPGLGDVIDKHDLIYFLMHEIADKQASCTDIQVERMADGIWVTLKDFGFLVETDEGSKKSMRINRPYLSDQLMLQIIYFLKKNNVSDYNAIHNKIWYLFGHNGPEIITKLRKRPDMYIIQSAGSIVDLCRVEKDDKKFLAVLSAGV